MDNAEKQEPKQPTVIRQLEIEIDGWMAALPNTNSPTFNRDYGHRQKVLANLEGKIEGARAQLAECQAAHEAEFEELQGTIESLTEVNHAWAAESAEYRVQVAELMVATGELVVSLE